MIIKYLLAKTKKYSNDIILLFVFSFIGLIIGILIHNKIEPKWNVIWDLGLDDDVKSSLIVYNKDINKTNLNDIFYNLFDKVISNFHKNNSNFKSLKKIYLNNSILRYETSQIEKSKNDSKIYISNLNNFITDNLQNEIQVLIKNSIKKSFENIKDEILSLNDLIKIIEGQNKITESADNSNLNLKNAQIDINFFSETNIQINKLEDLKYIVNFFDNPKNIETMSNHTTLVQSFKSLERIMIANKKMLKLEKNYRAMNKKPSKIFFGLIFSIISFLMFIIFIKIRKIYYPKIHN